MQNRGPHNAGELSRTIVAVMSVLISLLDSDSNATLPHWQRRLSSTALAFRGSIVGGDVEVRH